jgi:CBS domain-containing protein
MAAVFGAASRATFAFIVFAFEITRDYNAILPLMLACVIADLIALRYLKTSIMTEKLARRGLTVPHEYQAAVFSLVRVGEIMNKNIQPLPEDTTVAELAEASKGHNPPVDLSEGLPVVSKEGHLVGLVTRGDLLRAFETDPEGKISILEAGSEAPIVAYADEPLQDALNRMLQHDVGRLPVVNREEPKRLAGYLTRTNLLSAWTRQLEEEGVREHGWLARWRVNGSRTAAK